jgi:hypothetical protein
MTPTSTSWYSSILDLGALVTTTSVSLLPWGYSIAASTVAVSHCVATGEPWPMSGFFSLRFTRLSATRLKMTATVDICLLAFPQKWS